jgi:hypothetical protein
VVVKAEPASAPTSPSGTPCLRRVRVVYPGYGLIGEGSCEAPAKPTR